MQMCLKKAEGQYLIQHPPNLQLHPFPQKIKKDREWWNPQKRWKAEKLFHRAGRRNSFYSAWESRYWNQHFTPTKGRGAKLRNSK